MPDATRLHDDIPPDIALALDRTTPRDLSPLDLSDLARRGRRRGRRQRSALGVAAVAVVSALAAAAVVQPWSHDRSPDRADIKTDVAGPNGEPLTDPAGSWSALTDPPFTPRYNSFGGTLGDGRVLLWGGEEQGTATVPTSRFDGGIYDPATDEWTSIAEAPPTLGPRAGPASLTYQLVGDRLAVVSHDGPGGTTAAVVYDASEDRWYEAPPEERHVGIDGRAGIAWDGDTLALVHLDPADGAPVTVRWKLGEERWRTGAPPPLSPRSGYGTAFDGGRLAVWGGSTNPGGTGDQPDDGILADGAVYDVADDSWQMLPAGPLAGRVSPAMLWDHDRLVIAGGRPSANGETGFDDVAAYSPSTGTWESLPPAPHPDSDGAPLWVARGATITQGSDSFAEGAAQFVVTQPSEPQTGLITSWVLVDDRWTLAPAAFPDTIGDFTIATSGGSSIEPDTRFSVRIRTGPDEWLDAAEAPFTDVTGATVVVTGNQLVVVGGHLTGVDDWAMPGKAWAFDLAG